MLTNIKNLAVTVYVSTVMLLTLVILIVTAVLALFIVPFSYVKHTYDVHFNNKVVGFNFSTWWAIMKNIDDLCASIFFFEFERTISGVLGRGQYQNIPVYTFWAKAVNWLFLLLKIDTAHHCIFHYLLEEKLLRLRAETNNQRDSIVNSYISERVI